MKTYFKYEGLIKSKEAAEQLLPLLLLAHSVDSAQLKYLVISYQFKLKPKMVKYSRMM